MKRKQLFNIFLCAAIIFISLPYSVSAQEPEYNYIPGEIVITTSEDILDSSESDSILSAEEHTIIDFDKHEISLSDEVETYTDENDNNTYILKAEGNIIKTCRNLEKIPGVICAEPNIMFHTMDFTMPGEVSYPTQLYQNYQKWYFDLLQIPDAWEQFETAGEGVVIAIIDNGYNIYSNEFPINLWTDENGNHGWNTYLESADISPIYNGNGNPVNNTSHGSHVAGIIGMKANNKSTIGAAFGAELMLINAAQYHSYYDKENNFIETTAFDPIDVAQAIDYARTNGADIINLSLGAAGSSSVVETAINKAYDEGIAVIAAAGNSATSTDAACFIPASLPNVIGVMAPDYADPTQLAPFSNYDPSGKYYDVAAPGTRILSIIHTNNQLTALQGTSQAAPLVSACAALFLSAYPNATVDELYEAIRKSPTTMVTSNTDIVTDTTHYFKLINAVDLLAYGKSEPRINYINNAYVLPSFSFISGLKEGFTDISEFITVTDGTYKFIPTSYGNGTGSVIEVYDINGELYKTLTVLIYGDINGDSYADGQDAVESSFIIGSPESYPDHQYYAADVDWDGYVTESDYNIIARYAIGLDFVLQG